MPRASILVVEDDPDMRELETEALQLDGYEVETAHDGLAALEALKRRPSLPLAGSARVPRRSRLGEPPPPASTIPTPGGPRPLCA